MSKPKILLSQLRIIVMELDEYQEGEFPEQVKSDIENAYELLEAAHDLMYKLSEK